MDNKLRIARVSTNFFVQLDAAKKIHDREVQRFRDQGLTVIEHTELDAEVFYE